MEMKQTMVKEPENALKQLESSGILSHEHLFRKKMELVDMIDKAQAEKRQQQHDVNEMARENTLVEHVKQWYYSQGLEVSDDEIKAAVFLDRRNRWAPVYPESSFFDSLILNQFMKKEEYEAIFNRNKKKIYVSSAVVASVFSVGVLFNYINAAIFESNLNTLKKDVAILNTDVSKMVNFKPLEDIQKAGVDFNGTSEEKNVALIASSIERDTKSEQNRIESFISGFNDNFKNIDTIEELDSMRKQFQQNKRIFSQWNDSVRIPWNNVLPIVATYEQINENEASLWEGIQPAWAGFEALYVSKVSEGNWSSFRSLNQLESSFNSLKNTQTEYSVGYNWINANRNNDVVVALSSSIAGWENSLKSLNYEQAEETRKSWSYSVSEYSMSYRLRLSNEQTGFSRKAKNPTIKEKNFYLVVEALDGSNNPVKLNVVNEETGKIELVSKFGVRVPESVFNEIKEDKMDNGLIENPWFGKKEKNSFDVQFNREVLVNRSDKTGYITRW